MSEHISEFAITLFIALVSAGVIFVLVWLLNFASSGGFFNGVIN